ncbi:ankyrin repeat-containing domain protein [Aspergillus karnatakaensis]|uniref:ankyrin repeat domain-containing protein n=1 Tax=Aspergillus karnatakaensis TaxID=1810916 RepID=UPI003CCD3C4A
MVVAKKQLPILIAALSGHVDMVKLLLENGVDVNCMSPYQVPTIVYAACESRNLEFVRYLILEKKADISIANTDGDTPLGRAVSMGHPQIVRFLLEHRAPHVPNNQGVYPIHLAAAFNRTAELEILLSFEIDVNIHHPASRRTPIWWAAYSGSIHALDILVQHGGDVNMADAWGQTPVFIAAINNLPDVLQKLLGLGADPSIATEDGVTPLGVASEKGFAGTVDILTEYEKGSTARTLAES